MMKKVEIIVLEYIVMQKLTILTSSKLNTIKLKSKLMMTVAFVLLSSFLYAQNNHFSIIENIKANDEVFNPNYNLNKACYYDSVIYFIPFIASNKREIKCYDMRLKIFSTLKIKKTKKNKILFEENIHAISVIKNNIVLLIDSKIVCVTKGDKSDPLVTYIIKNEYSYDIAKVFNNSVFLYVNYNFHPNDQTEKHVWAILDPVTGSITKTKIKPRDNDAFGSLVNSWVDTHADKIVYASTTNYNIKFYNSKFEQTDSIITTEFDKNKVYLDLCKAKEYSREAIIEQVIIDDSLLTRIIKVYYVNDTSVLTLIKLPKTKKLRFDYWQKTNNKWELNFQETNTRWYDADSSYSQTKISFGAFFQNMSGFVYTGNNKFAYIEYPSMPTLTTTKFNQKIDFDDVQNKLMNEDKISYGIKTILLTPNR